jgi:hypothetical protein
MGFGTEEDDTHGCILADDVGMGKSLQVITLIWILLSIQIDVRAVAEYFFAVCSSKSFSCVPSHIGKKLGQ